jgi:hypothetical protein
MKYIKKFEIIYSGDRKPYSSEMEDLLKKYKFQVGDYIEVTNTLPDDWIVELFSGYGQIISVDTTDNVLPYRIRPYELLNADANKRIFDHWLTEKELKKVDNKDDIELYINANKYNL